MPHHLGRTCRGQADGLALGNPALGLALGRLGAQRVENGDVFLEEHGAVMPPAAGAAQEKPRRNGASFRSGNVTFGVVSLRPIRVPCRVPL